MACNDFASLFFKTYDGAMAFLEIAFNTGGVQCFCIFPKTDDTACLFFSFLCFFVCLFVWSLVCLCVPFFFSFVSFLVSLLFDDRCSDRCWRTCPCMPLNATLFTGDLLESYESPTISKISGRNVIKQSWEKTCKIRWQSPLIFRRDFFDLVFP